MPEPDRCLANRRRRGARRLSHPRRGTAARERSTAVLAVEPTAFSDRRTVGAARGIHCRHRDPAAHGRGHPRPRCGRSRSSSRAVTIFRWAGIRSGSSMVAGMEVYRRVQAPRSGEPGPGRRLRSDDARHHRRPRPRPAGERRLLPRQHDGRRGHLGRRQERHGPAVSRRGGPSRSAQPDALAR